MSEPDNLTHRLLREMRAEAAGRHEDVERQMTSLRDEVRDNSKRLDSLRQAMQGESVLGRYAVAGVEDRLDELEKRIAAIEARG